MSIALHSETDLRPRSGFGISSFALGTISALSFLLVLGYVTLFKEAASNGLVAVVMVLIWITNLIGIGLGIAGVVHRLSRNTFLILGLVLNFGIMTLSMALIAIGFWIQYGGPANPL
jgi:hypothetical protein